MKFENKWRNRLEEYVDKAIEYAKQKNTIVTCRCGETPGGTKHIGNFNDNIRSFFIFLDVKKRGYPARHVQTRDDMDPFRKLPSGFLDLDKIWHESTETLIKSYDKCVGTPLYFINDPLDCCENYSVHFSKIYEEECREMGLEDTQYFSTYELYKSGKFNPYLREIFENLDIARKIDLSIERSKPRDYVPVWVICENCEKVTGRVYNVNLEEETIDYVCTDRNLTIKYRARGCGHKGTVDWKNGNSKMDWEFEWPAQMLMFETTIEPFGKEHHIGSWPFSKRVLTEVYKQERPIVFFYEYFLINKKKMATRHGNIIPISTLLEVLEPEVIRFIYTKRPNKQRNLDLSKIIHFVNEFDRAEKIYFGLKRARNEKEEAKLKKSYESSMLHRIPKRFPKRLSYTTISNIIQTAPQEKWEKTVNQLLSDADNSYALKRFSLVRNWLDNYAPDESRIELFENTLCSLRNLDETEKDILEDFSEFFSKKRCEKEINEEIQILTDRYKVNKKQLFIFLYQILLRKNSGPPLAQFLSIQSTPEVQKTLRVYKTSP